MVFCALFKGRFWKPKSSKSSSWKTEDLEAPVGGKVIGGILDVIEWQQNLFTFVYLASTWLVPCLPIQTLEKLSKSWSQCSVTFLASAHFTWKAQNRFSDVNLPILEAPKKFAQRSCWPPLRSTVVRPTASHQRRKKMRGLRFSAWRLALMS